MSEQPGAILRALHAPGHPFVLANAWDIGSARVLAALGAKAIGTSSAAFAFTLGLPDGARITRDQALGHAADIVAATPRPVSADLESGYGETPGEVAETIRLAGAAGLAGASIEDTELPGTESLSRRHCRRARRCGGRSSPRAARGLRAGCPCRRAHAPALRSR